jgi:hypothetical protein
MPGSTKPAQKLCDSLDGHMRAWLKALMGESKPVQHGSDVKGIFDMSQTASLAAQLELISICVISAPGNLKLMISCGVK